MTPHDALEQGRDSFGRQAWGDAYAHFSAADRTSPLGIEDLDMFAQAAYLTGRDEDCVEHWTRAHQASLDSGDLPRAVRCAFWIGFSLALRGKIARAGGWFGRIQRLLEDAPLECSERGYLLLPAMIQNLEQGNFAATCSLAIETDQIGRRFGDPDLMILGRLGHGQALVFLGKSAEGLALLDEVMVSVTAGEATPILVGLIYCAVIETCYEIFDLSRAQEWTGALSRMCETQPDLVPYRGKCLIHRAELLNLHGSWADAMVEARRAGELLSNPDPQPAVGAAFAQQADLHRLRGEFDKAEEAYREASRWGHPTQPGFALLRLAQGDSQAAEAAIRRIMDEVGEPIPHSRSLAASVEIMLAVGDVPSAREAANALAEVASAMDMPMLHATAAYAMGTVLLAEGDARAAVAAARRAWSIWTQLDVPYDAARARVAAGLACRELGDQDGATLEIAAALRVLRELGAGPEIARVEALARHRSSPLPGRLTMRELEVLRFIAAGHTNRRIADELFLSEKTVARHVSNIFAKIDVSSRSAATAFAFANKLV